MKRIITAAAAIVMAACTEKPEYTLPAQEEDGTRPEETVEARATFSISAAGTEMPGEATVAVYSNGELAWSGTTSDGTLQAELNSGLEYDYIVTAGIPGFQPPALKSELDAVRVPVDAAPDDGFPMAAGGSFTLDAGGERIDAELQRLHARVRISADISNLEGLEIRSVRICQASSDVLLFPAGNEGSSAISVQEGDTASAEEISAMNSGGEAVLYLPENCQGTLLPQNSDPWEKIPDSIPEKAGLCSYLELSGTFSGEGTLNGDVTYRFYLGEDATSDFSVRRNRDYSVMLIASREGIAHPSWKVDGGAVYADMPFIALNSSGRIYWRTREDSGLIKFEGEPDWRGIAFGNGRYVAVGFGGKTAVSLNGTVWQPGGSGLPNLFDVTFGEGLFIAVAGDGRIFSSADGIDWSTRAETDGLMSVAYGNGRFVAAGSSLASSEDGISWDVQESPRTLYEVTWGKDEYLAVGVGSTSYVSADGDAWTERKMSRFFDMVSGFNYGNGTYILTDGWERTVYYSSDGVQWTAGGKDMTGCVSDFHDGVFIAAYNYGTSNAFFSSSVDGRKWKRIDSCTGLGNLNCVCIMR